ncbi:MAG TPA: ferritin-like domain-containing protein [Spirochaetota bacterium]|nr:ferritin-like domain-containing protein [Spirochaetota bacterium]HPI87973.1 ferritin-like domain-containing protein [Spirochaetota bacterium]HPR46684.1 ferritin-like domain-containing protein [Spirochaetota bacterium]
MKKLKKLIRESYRMERIGTGIYRALAGQYQKRPELSQRFEVFSDQEAMHGRLFQVYYRKNFGRLMRGEQFWYLVGVAGAVSMRLLPLSLKLRIITREESRAVAKIEEALSTGEETSFHKILRRILPDEKTHAALYMELFH